MMMKKNRTPRQRPAAACSHEQVPLRRLPIDDRIPPPILPSDDPFSKANTILTQRLRTNPAQGFFLNKPTGKEVESPISDCLDSFVSVGKHVTD